MRLRNWLLLLCLPLAAAAAPAVDPLPAPRPLEAPPADATPTASGMAYRVLRAGPDPDALVRAPVVEYQLSGWSADGVTRLNARQQGVRRAWLRDLMRSQPGLARALLTTPVGETRRWWMQPQVLGTGYPGMPALPHVFDLTVIGGSDPLKPPAEVAVVPADAQRTPSGLAYRVLARGKGGARPGPRDLVLVDYTAWTPDGRVFDSSLPRGGRASLPLAMVIPGWREGLQLMARGDRFRFWIPGPLAYDNLPTPGAPSGMLVFDVTLYGFSADPGTPDAEVDDPEAVAAD